MKLLPRRWTPWRRAPETPPPAADFAARCDPHKPTLLRVARRLTRGDDDQAQDLVQETLIRAFEACVAGDYREQGQIRPYLLRILTNRFLSESRRGKWRAERNPREEEDLPDTPTSPESGPANALLRETLDEPLERALAALPDALRVTVLLVDVEGLEYEEAARVLGIPTGTVRSRLFRSRKMLYTALLPCARERGWVVRPKEVRCTR